MGGMAEATRSRLGYIDWMRGLACVLMFQTHCYDSWLGGAARETQFMKWSQLVGTLPAPLFLFLAGVSSALVTGKMRAKEIPASVIAQKSIRRGAEIFSLGLLFRLQEFLLGQPWAPWTDLLRVDILNTIGVSMILMGVLCRVAQKRISSIVGAVATALAISMLTPPLWTTWQPRWLPWPLESYINGVHTFNQPQPWLFPIFPWAAFAFAGLAVGFVLFSDWARASVTLALASLGAFGVVLYRSSLWLDTLPVRLYAEYDFWHTSPPFFLARIGVLLMILFLVYVWCQWGAGQWKFSPIIQLGQTSLLVYWVHIEFVYGRFSILKKQAQSIPMASLGLLIIFVAMVLLSLAKTRYQDRGEQLSRRFTAMWRRSVEGGAESGAKETS
jgi:uncharacterized membrane protein